MTITKQKPVCRVISGSGAGFRGKQGLDYFAGISAETVGSTGICMHLLTIPPGGRASAHLHENHETAIYLVSGDAEMWFGEDLSEYLTMKAGEFLYIPAGVPHKPANPSATTPCVAVLARTDPNEQESVVLRPDLDEVFERRGDRNLLRTIRDIVVASACPHPNATRKRVPGPIAMGEGQWPNE